MFFSKGLGKHWEHWVHAPDFDGTCFSISYAGKLAAGLVSGAEDIDQLFSVSHPWNVSQVLATWNLDPSPTKFKEAIGSQRAVCLGTFTFWESDIAMEHGHLESVNHPQIRMFLMVMLKFLSV